MSSSSPSPSAFIPAPIFRDLFRPLPKHFPLTPPHRQAKQPAAVAPTNTETCTSSSSSSKLSARSEFWDLFSRNLVNSAPPSHPVIVEFTRRLPSYLVDYAYYRMTHYLFTTEHSDGEMWNVRHLFDAVANVSSFEILSPKQARFRAHLVNDKYIEGIQSRSFSDLHMIYVGRQPGRTWYDMLSQLPRHYISGLRSSPTRAVGSPISALRSKTSPQRAFVRAVMSTWPRNWTTIRRNRGRYSRLSSSTRR